MLLQFAGDNILGQFLLDIGIVALANFNDALDIAVNPLGKHVFYLHDVTPYHFTSWNAL